MNAKIIFYTIIQFHSKKKKQTKPFERVFKKLQTKLSIYELPVHLPKTSLKPVISKKAPLYNKAQKKEHWHC